MKAAYLPATCNISGHFLSIKYEITIFYVLSIISFRRYFNFVLDKRILEEITNYRRSAEIDEQQKTGTGQNRKKKEALDDTKDICSHNVYIIKDTTVTSHV